MPAIVVDRWKLWASLSLSAISLTGCGNAGTAQAGGSKTAAKSVQVETVRVETVHRPIEAVGTLAAQDEVTVSSQSEGLVLRVLADVGDAVRTGQPLVEIDREKLQYNLEQQQASLARTLTRYGASDAGHLPPVEETPDVRKAAAELAQARQAYERADALHKRQLISVQSLDDAQTELRSRQASYDAALQGARNLRAEIDVSEAAVKLADRELRDADIRAPFDGYVQKRMVSIGELVKAETAVMTIVRSNPLRVITEIPERMAPWVKVGQAIELRVDAYPDRTFNAAVSRISPAVNAQTRTFTIEASAPNAESLLKPGTFARVHLETALVQQIITIPYAAMQHRYGVNRAFVVKGDKLSAQELKTGDRRGDRIEIVAGLNPGDTIALTDVDTLSDGMLVTTAVRQTD
jgi:multidrug efflux pump subunit AcrA (membrane-fusion protein)